MVTFSVRCQVGRSWQVAPLLLVVSWKLTVLPIVIQFRSGIRSMTLESFAQFFSLLTPHSPSVRKPSRRATAISNENVSQKLTTVLLASSNLQYRLLLVPASSACCRQLNWPAASRLVRPRVPCCNKTSVASYSFPLCTRNDAPQQ